jgi:hypothetical protein
MSSLKMPLPNRDYRLSLITRPKETILIVILVLVSIISISISIHYQIAKGIESPYHFGFLLGEKDARIYLFDDSQCDGFLSTNNYTTSSNQSRTYQNICYKAYDHEFSKIINEHHTYTSALDLIHKTLAYQTGFKLGRVWNSSDNSCNFPKYRDQLICYNGWLDVRTPGLNDPVHCSPDSDDLSNSCYNIGESDGSDLAGKYINTCNELNYLPKPPGPTHSKSYIEGWNNGISDTNAAAANDDGTYGHECH